MESYDEVREYRERIREMIISENGIRNQRTNWFLVIQGFMIAGVCQFNSECSFLLIMIALVGMISSVFFWHATWRSTLAISFALACWKRRTNSKQREKLAPVSLLTDEIL